MTDYFLLLWKIYLTIYILSEEYINDSFYARTLYPYLFDIDCSAVDLLCYGERNGNPLKGPSEEGDAETTKKILNNFNYANFLSEERSAGIILYSMPHNS
jgi:hypothetical protein